jgi:hypothetical protein
VALSYLRLRLLGSLALWTMIVMPLGAASVTGAMTAAMWSQHRHAPSTMFAVLMVLLAAAPLRWRSTGYIEDRASLGQRNGPIARFSWIDLADVVAVSSGRQSLPPTQYLVLWSRRQQTDRPAAALARFVSWAPPALHRWSASHGELHAFRIDWALLGRRNSRRLLARLRARGLDLPDELLPRHLHESEHRSGDSPGSFTWARRTRSSC